MNKLSRSQHTFIIIMLNSVYFKEIPENSTTWFIVPKRNTCQKYPRELMNWKREFFLREYENLCHTQSIHVNKLEAALNCFPWKRRMGSRIILIKNEYHYRRFPGKTTVKAWYCFPMSHNNLKAETYSVLASRKEKLQRQINLNNFENSRTVHETRNKYFIRASCCC